MESIHKGRLFIISGPSGAGKGAIRDRLFHMLDGLSYSISCTTRAPRSGEVDGRDYYFISPEQFINWVEKGLFAEWAQVHDRYYGTLSSEIELAIEKGLDVVLEIDIQGAKQMIAKHPEAVSVFIMPPSPEELERRLRNRGTESEESMALRLNNARIEMKNADSFKKMVINENLDDAVRELSDIIKSYRNR